MDESASAVAPCAMSETEMAALPMIEAPAISPVDVGAETPSDIAPAEPPLTAAKSAGERFRATAAAQIAGARERLAQRKLPSMSTVALLAGVAGAVTSIGAARLMTPAEQDMSQVQVLSNTVSRLNAVVAGLREEIERTTKLSETQLGKSTERLDRIEKAQAEPSAKIIKLSDAVEKMRNAQAAASAAASREVTGSIAPPATKPVVKPKPAPTIVEGWTLRELDRDVALVEGKRGLVEIQVGNDIPGVGRVEGFRKQDGRWVVVTPKGLIVSR